MALRINEPKIKTIIKTIVKRPKKIYVASVDSKIVHEKNCPFTKKIEKKKRIYFRSKTKAFNARYRACNCILEVKKRRRAAGKKAAKKVPSPRTIVKTIVKTVIKRPKKHYVAAKEGDTLHIASCPFAKNINPKSRVIFKSETKAFHEGYNACNCIKKTI